VAHVAAVGITPSPAEVAEDVPDFQSGTLHDGAETTPKATASAVSFVDPERKFISLTWRLETGPTNRTKHSHNFLADKQLRSVVVVT
jgi:hypothetical protein